MQLYKDFSDNPCNVHDNFLIFTTILFNIGGIVLKITVKGACESGFNRKTLPPSPFSIRSVFSYYGASP